MHPCTSLPAAGRPQWRRHGNSSYHFRWAELQCQHPAAPAEAGEGKAWRSPRPCPTGLSVWPCPVTSLFGSPAPVCSLGVGPREQSYPQTPVNTQNNHPKDATATRTSTRMTLMKIKGDTFKGKLKLKLATPKRLYNGILWGKPAGQSKPLVFRHWQAYECYCKGLT